MRTIKSITLGICAAAALLSPVASRAAEFKMLYNGTFNAQDSLAPAFQSGGAFAPGTPFTLTAWFDNSSANNYAPPLPGFVAYNPSLAIITVGGKTYLIDPISTNPTAGMTVAIFDPTNVFNHGLYGIGILQNPPIDGAGIVADFSGASPDFTVGNIVSTMFTGYNGVGHGSGACTSGTPPACPHAVTPFLLHDSMGNAFDLTLGNYEEHSPADPINTVSLIAVPEPVTFGFAVLALIACGVIRRKRT